VRWIVSFAAGGPNDVVARLVGQYLSEKLGQQVVIENKGGAGGNVGMEAVLSAPPDGYTIGFVAPNNAINATMYEKLPFDFLRDSAPVGGMMLLTNVMVINPDVPAKTVPEFITYARLRSSNWGGNLEAARIHHACRGNGGSLATRGARATAHPGDRNPRQRRQRRRFEHAADAIARRQHG
jgi:tripartite-type tricarboxylate transporter receptor subunit TctC